MFYSIAIALLVFLLILEMGDTMDILPTLAMCMFRGRDNRTLYNNTRMRRTSVRVMLAMIPSVIAVLSFYDIHPLVRGEELYIRALWTSGLLAAYCALKYILRLLFYRRHRKSNEMNTIVQMACTFIILGAIILFIEFGVCRIIGAENSQVNEVLRWSIVAVYAIYLLRTIQVFSSQRGFFAAFLYLCALEILPTAILVAPYFIK